MLTSPAFRNATAIAWALMTGAVLSPPPSAHAVGFDRDDFIVSSGFGAGFSVYDHDFTYKGELGDTTFDAGFGMDFNHEGQLVVRGITPPTIPENRQFVVFESDGSLATNQPQFVVAPPGGLDVKVGPNGNYFVGGQDAPFGETNGLLEVTPDGNLVRQLDVADYEGVAILPTGVVLGGGGSGSGFLRAFELSSGDQLYALDEPTDSVPTNPVFDEGQGGASSMRYSHQSNSVLMADRNNGGVYERNLDGQFVRKFEIPSGLFGQSALIGVTRGPAGDVFAAFSRKVVRWSAEGDWIETIDLPQLGTAYTWNIVWAGNAPGLTFVEGDDNGDGFVSHADLDLVLLN